MVGLTVNVFKNLKKQRRSSFLNFDVFKEIFEQNLKDKLKNEIYSGEHQIGLSKKNERKIREEKEKKMIEDGLKTFREELDNVNLKISEMNELNVNSSKNIIEMEKNIMKYVAEVNKTCTSTNRH